MKRIVILLTTFLLLSCAKEAPEAGGVGSLSLAVKVPEGQNVKAALTSEQLLATAHIDIYYSDFSGLVRSYRYDQARRYLSGGCQGG